MTKEQLSRLIDLSTCCVSREAFEELDALQVEFEAWDPEEAFRSANKEAGMWRGATKLALERAEIAKQQRDEARMVARAAYWNVPTLIMDLPTGKYWHQDKYDWLNEEPTDGQ